ncbi:MAG: lactate dehydrogenase, partial [Clostridia bacterium]|nr:lactate dehydrogenase [Clostridia bacterium]
ARPSDLVDRGPARLMLREEPPGDAAFLERMAADGLLCVNTAFPDALLRARPFIPGREGRRLQIAGLGDVGTALLCGLALAGAPFDLIGIYDPDEKRCLRCQMEASQVLALNGRRPRVEILPEDALFDCDVFVFAASAGVPPPGSRGDVRLAQLRKNRAILASYARRARETSFGGLFFQVSDPIDILCRELFILSNTDESGSLDYRGLRPEQIIGLGLGVMFARAACAAEARGLQGFSETGRAYGPHGAGLVVANATGAAYDDALSRELTEAAVGANLAVRETGYKPYIAPALSSACVQIVRAVRGESFDAAVALDGAYLGCRARLTRFGVLPERAALNEALFGRIEAAYRALKEYRS